MVQQDVGEDEPDRTSQNNEADAISHKVWLMRKGKKSVGRLRKKEHNRARKNTAQDYSRKSGPAWKKG